MENILLIVDDESDLREILSLFMEDEGIKNKTCKNGEEALQFLLSAEGKTVTTVLTDIKMPKMDGLTLLKKMREHQLETPVVLLTGYGDKEKAVEALKFGAFDFHDKPFDRKKLLDTVNNAMQMGLSMKNLEAEIEEILLKTKVPDAEKAKAREGIKALLLMKKQRKEFTGKKTA